MRLIYGEVRSAKVLEMSPGCIETISADDEPETLEPPVAQFYTVVVRDHLQNPLLGFVNVFLASFCGRQSHRNYDDTSISSQVTILYSSKSPGKTVLYCMHLMPMTTRPSASY